MGVIRPHGSTVSEMSELASDQVAPGRYLPGAPTDPYVLALEHTVRQIMGWLRACKLTVRYARGPADIAGACAGTGSN